MPLKIRNINNQVLKNILLGYDLRPMIHDDIDKLMSMIHPVGVVFFSIEKNNVCIVYRNYVTSSRFDIKDDSITVWKVILELIEDVDHVHYMRLLSL